MNGWMGKILRVDLSGEKTRVQALDPKVAREYLGGRGLGIYYMNREVDPTCDPFSPENLLIMSTGPLTGTRAPTGGRYMITTKSPLTGAITCSNSGGKFPTELKKAGFDAVIISGKAHSPLYLYIDNEKAELRPAGHLWGKTVPETVDAVLSETHEKARVACIGPGGENRVLFAAVMNDRHRAAGRSGVGAVMGAKNLKAVVVQGKPKSVPGRSCRPSRPYKMTFWASSGDAAKQNPPPLRLHGTAVTVAATQNYGALPTKNFQQGTFDGWQGIHGETLTDKYLVKNSASAAPAPSAAAG